MGNSVSSRIIGILGEGLVVPVLIGFCRTPVFTNQHRVADTEQLPAASSSLCQGEFWGDCLSPSGPYTWRWPTQEAVQSEPSCPLVQEPSRGGWDWKPSLKPSVATQQALDPSMGHLPEVAPFSNSHKTSYWLAVMLWAGPLAPGSTNFP